MDLILITSGTFIASLFGMNCMVRAAMKNDVTAVHVVAFAAGMSLALLGAVL